MLPQQVMLLWLLARIHRQKEKKIPLCLIKMQREAI